jgi:hypothetical protein
MALVTYGRATCPTVYGFDSAEFATAGYTLGLAHSPGYPLYTLLAKGATLLPVGEVAYRVNLVSAVLGGLSIGALYACVWLLVRSRLAACAATLAFAFSYTYWAQAVVAEVYTLQILLVALALAFFLSWQRSGKRSSLLAAAAFFGAAVTHHTSTGLLLPGVLYLLWRQAHRRQMRGRELLAAAGCFLAPLVVYAYIPIRDAMDPAYNWPRDVGLDVRTAKGLWLHVTSASFRHALSLSPEVTSEGAMSLVTWLGRNFVWLGVPFGLAGLVRLWGRDRELLWFSLILFVPTAVFFVHYDVFDQEVFFLIPFFIWTWWMGSGFRGLLDGLKQWFPERRVALVCGGLIALAPALFSLASNFPRLDFSRQTALAEDCRSTLVSLPRNAWVFSAFPLAQPLRYFQIVEGLRPDVEVYDSSHMAVAIDMLPENPTSEDIAEAVGGLHREDAARALEVRPTYTTYVDHGLSLAFDFHRDGNLYTISPKRAPRQMSSLNVARPLFVTFDNTLVLAAVTVRPTTLRPIDPFRVSFAAALRRPTSKHYRLYLVVSEADSARRVLVTKYEPGSLAETTDTWPQDVFFQQSYDVGIPGPVDPGKYLVSVGVIDEDGPVAPTDPRGIPTPAVAVTYLQLEY